MKHTRITALVLAVCLCAAAMTACGDNNSDKTAAASKAASIDDMNEEELDAALDKLEKDTAEQIEKEMKEAEAESAAAPAESEAEPAEKTYEPTEEIKNAPLNSGYIQIGDTVFRSGGYMTVAEFVEKYKDKYDVSEIHLDEYMVDGADGAYIHSLEDPRIKIFVHLSKPKDSESDRVKIPDAVVFKLEMPYFDNQQYGHGNDGGDFHYLEDVIFFPQGLKTMDYDDIIALMNEQGVEEYEYFSDVKNYYKEDKDGIAVTLEGEENLLGDTPKIHYFFNFDPKTLQGTNLALFVI